MHCMKSKQIRLSALTASASLMQTYEEKHSCTPQLENSCQCMGYMLGK